MPNSYSMHPTAMPCPKVPFSLQADTGGHFTPSRSRFGNIFQMRKLITLMLGLALVASAQVKKKIIVPAGGTSGPNFPPGLLVGDTLYVSAFIGFDSKK